MTIFTSVERAEPSDMTEVMRLLVNTAEWLLSKGSTQWNGLLKGEDSCNTPEAISRGEVYIFKQDLRTAGMVMLLKEPNAWDRELWGERALDGSAIYLHRLAVDRKFAGMEASRTGANGQAGRSPRLPGEHRGAERVLSRPRLSARRPKLEFFRIVQQIREASVTTQSHTCPGATRRGGQHPIAALLSSGRAVFLYLEGDSS